MKIVCASSLTLGREIFSAMGDVVLVPEKDITAAVVKDAGLLPSCVLCETIRDAKGQWHGLEEYIHSHNEADYTVSLCPACTGKGVTDAAPGRNGAGGQPDQSGSAERGFRVSSNNGNALTIAVKPRCKATLP